eukprot:TRINITY_DN8391_c0_g1_i2.p1 TRINITY_DN8391_c0_g1~~TRINITY_DN8391_c0_g1_i2.p1  ORF type:complete len:103 (+),score=15.16 TRINITY_DN8391_c0_g1_i2:271-579(+)
MLLTKEQIIGRQELNCSYTYVTSQLRNLSNSVIEKKQPRKTMENNNLEKPVTEVYTPVYRSGAWGLIVALAEAERKKEVPINGFIKEHLIQMSAPYCDVSYA